MEQEYLKAIDKGLEGVVACHTSISFIVNATLTYRGYTIEDLAKNSNFEETVFLLWNNRLPKQEEMAEFSKDLRSKAYVSPEMLSVLKTLPTKGVHPMAWLRTAVSAMSLWDKKAQSTDHSQRLEVARELVAKVGVLMGIFESLRQGRQPVEVDPSKSLAWNFLYSLKGEKPDSETEKIFDTCLLLHADHELNCSAFAARVTASSLSDIYSAVVSGIGTLKGPLHGGANEQVMKTLSEEVKKPEEALAWTLKALEEKRKIMGFGHRVYKNGDPRAKILKSMSETLCLKTGNSKWFEMSKIMEDVVKEKKGLLPNVDFYSATVYYSLGIPLDLYTPIFAVARVSGWLAHILEQWENNRIYRPRGKWSGAENRQWKPFSKRQ